MLLIPQPRLFACASGVDPAHHDLARWRGDHRREGEPCRLSAAQQEQLKGVLLQLHGAAAAGCRTELWTLKRIGEVIRK